MLCVAFLAAAFLFPVEHVNVQVNGETAKPGVMLRGKAFVPVRGVFEKLGIKVTWENSSVIASIDERTIVLWPHLLKASIDGQEVAIDTAPETIDGATYVPLRLIAETLGVAIVYNKKEKSVKLFSKGGMRADPKAFSVEAWYFANNLSITVSGPPDQTLVAVLPEREFPLEEKTPGVYSANTTFEPPMPATKPVTAYVTANGKPEHLTFNAKPDPFELICSAGTSKIVAQKDAIMFSVPAGNPRLDTTNSIVSIDGPQGETDVQPDKITIHLAPGKSVVSIQTVDTVGKHWNVDREFKAAPYAAFEASCDPLKPGDPVQLTVYGKQDAHVRLKIGNAYPEVKFTQLAPGEYAGQYVARAEDNLNGQDLGASIDGEMVWAVQPPLKVVPFAIGELNYRHSESGNTVFEIAATPKCVLSLVDRQGAAHPFSEIRAGLYDLEAPPGGFPDGKTDAALAIKSATALESFEPQRFAWGPNIHISALPQGSTSQRPTELFVQLELDPLLCFKANSWRVQLNSQRCENVQLAARGFRVGNLPKLEGTNTALFEAEDLVGNPVRFEWTFTIR